MDTPDKVTEQTDAEATISHPTPEATKPAPQTAPTFTKAQVDKMVEDALKREGGRINKSLEDRVKAIEAENQKYRDQALAATAAKYNLTVEQVKDAGIEDPEKVEKFASLFAKQESPEQPSLKVDSGKTTGGGKAIYKESQIADYSFYAAHKNDIIEALKEGRIKTGE